MANSKTKYFIKQKTCAGISGVAIASAFTVFSMAFAAFGVFSMAFASAFIVFSMAFASAFIVFSMAFAAFSLRIFSKYFRKPLPPSPNTFFYRRPPCRRQRRPSWNLLPRPPLSS